MEIDFAIRHLQSKMATIIRSVNVVLLGLKFTCFLSVLPPVRHAECCLQMSIKILAEENVFSYSEFAALNPAELVKIVLS